MKRVGIFYCKKIKDHSCLGCAKCFKGMDERNAEFGRYGDEKVEISFMTDCGDCPGLVMPRAALLMKTAEGMNRKPDALHFGTCVKKAVETAACPIKFEELKKKIEANFGVPVYWGTHDL